MQDGLSSGFHLRYRLVECLGSGAMGTVYRAQQTALNRTVAVKLLRLDPESPRGATFRRSTGVSEAGLLYCRRR